MKVTIVAGARPNFMKIAPIIKEIKKVQSLHPDLRFRLVHTGQHYDSKMSGEFFMQLGIPEPDVNLAAGGGTQAEQTAAIMINFERDLIQNPTDIVLVVGDVTSTMACAIVAKKLCIDVCHVEAGIRSGDISMPEEINRMVTDSICDLFFTTSEHANRNLLRLGVNPARIHFVGNTMIDTLIQHQPALTKPDLWDTFQMQERGYFLLTLHRPSNVDDPKSLKRWLDIILENTEDYPIIFPVHPRTRKILNSFEYSNLRLVQLEPLGYREFVYLIKHARGIITDSGGITEEATVLKVPCMTLRTSTERPETVEIGSNILIGNDVNKLRFYLKTAMDDNWKQSSIPPLWDGNAASRIVNSLLSHYSRRFESSFEARMFEAG